MNLVQTSLSVLADSKFYLEMIGESAYSSPLNILSGASIGQHSRHFIEFYQCLLAQKNGKSINYCLRERALEIEEKPCFAKGVVEQISTQINSLNLEKPVLLNTSKTGKESIKTTLGRELHYCNEHCIHHLALIKIGLKVIMPTLAIPEHFGVAASTIKHRQLISQ